MGHRGVEPRASWLSSRRSPAELTARSLCARPCADCVAVRTHEITFRNLFQNRLAASGHLHHGSHTRGLRLSWSMVPLHGTIVKCATAASARAALEAVIPLSLPRRPVTVASDLMLAVGLIVRHAIGIGTGFTPRLMSVTTTVESVERLRRKALTTGLHTVTLRLVPDLGIEPSNRPL